MDGDEPVAYCPASPALPVRSMYPGQFANLRGPVGLGTGVGEAEAAAAGVGVAGGGVGMSRADVGADVPLAGDDPAPHAARNALTPASAVPWRKRRRVRE